MTQEVKKAEGILCPNCDAQALVIEDKVFCQFCKVNGEFRRIEP